MANKTIGKLNKLLHTPNWLFVLLLIILILRIPSFFEPYSYGDEMIYLTLGQGIRKGIPLYSALHDNKPPLLYILAAIAGNLFWFKAILAFWHVVTVYIFWKFVDALFPRNKRFHIVATAVFSLLTTLPLLEGNIANAEVFMVGPIIAAFYILLTKKESPKNLALAGLFFSIATLFKVPAAFDIPAIIFFWMASKKLTKKYLKTIIRKTTYLSLGFTAPILLTLVWYFLRGAFSQYLAAAFLQNVGYLSSWRSQVVAEPFLVRNGPLLIRALVVAAGLGLLYIKRKKLSKNFLFVTAWLLLTLFAATLSERPYPHYLIQSVAPASILIAFIIAKKNIEQVLAIIPLTLATFVPLYFNFWYYPSLPYYTKFTKFASKQLSKEDYFKTFGGFVPRSYEIANFIRSSTEPDSHIYVWGDTATVYALSRRLPPIKYIADYHLKDFSSQEEVIIKLKENIPEIVVVMPESGSFPELTFMLYENYGLVKEIDGAKVWRLLSPSVRSLIAP